MQEVKQKINDHPWLISYNNINIPFRVSSQRIDNQGEFGNGTAATVYIKQDAPHLPEGINTLLNERRNQRMKTPLTELQIWERAQKNEPRLQEQAAHIILRMLLESPEFDFKSYKDRASPVLDPPTPVDVLPVGKEHATLQYLLGTVDIAEASYEDNSRLIGEWLNQLGWTNASDKQKFAIRKVVTWIGDQLTVDRLRHLFRFRGRDDNSFDRLDFSVVSYRWFHL
jgi:hypothetical protein